MKYLLTLLFFGGIYWFFFAGQPAQLPAESAVQAPQATQAGALSNAEQAYYSQVFDYTMEVIEPGQSFEWKSYNGHGKITVQKPFVSKSKATCRHFSEAFTIGGRSGSDKGVACKRQGRDGWCRLKPKDAQTCAMESPDNAFQGRIRDVQDAVESGSGFINKIENWLR